MSIGLSLESGLLLFLVVAGSLKARSRKEEVPSPTPTTRPPTEPSVRSVGPEIEAFRATNRVSLLEPEHEGTGILYLPNGVYGFSYAPTQEAPMFSRQLHQSFEVHKAPEGTIYLIGFVAEGESAELSVPDRYLDVTLYPEPWEGSTDAVCIPRERILRAKGPARSDGNPLFLELGPANTTVQ